MAKKGIAREGRGENRVGNWRVTRRRVGGEEEVRVAIEMLDSRATLTEQEEEEEEEGVYIYIYTHASSRYWRQ